MAQVRVRISRVSRFALGGSQVGHNMAVIGQPEHIGRFKIAVNHAGLMQALHAQANLAKDVRLTSQRRRRALGSSACSVSAASGIT